MTEQAKLPVAVFYDENLHHTTMGKSYELVVVFNDAKRELETIIAKPIENYVAFRKDVIGYSLEQIKLTYPKPFELGLSDELTFGMLGINLDSLKRHSEVLKYSPYKIIVSKAGICEVCSDATPYKLYAKTEEQHERLDFANELCVSLEAAHKYKPFQNKANLVTGLQGLVFHETVSNTFKANHIFVLEGYQVVN
jgi:hypothetical protein